MAVNLDISVAKKILSVVDAGLCLGVGVPEPGKMCVEAAVCFALGERHGDEPSCVAEPDRRFKIKLNDSLWSSNAARAIGLRRLSVQQLGTAGTDRIEWARILIELTIRRLLPEVAETAATNNPLRAEELRKLGLRCANEGTLEAALALRAAAADAAAAAAAAVAVAAAAAAAAAYAAAWAASAAADAAYTAAYAYADAYAERDRILTIAARCAEEAYERTGSPGVDLLRRIEAGEVA